MESFRSLPDLLATKTSSSMNDVMALTKSLIGRGVQFPMLVFEKGTNLLLNKSSSLGDEKWTLIERILLAAIKLDIEPWIGYCLNSLRSQFPDSVRVQRLAALYKESLEDWAAAESIYKDMLKATPDDLYVRKRLITCLKTQGRISDAISATIDQLEIFSSDFELWHELTMLYASECAFTKAVSSSEELLLLDPTSFYNILIHAELVASSGDLNLARKYYCKCLVLRPDEPRALWGLLTCSLGEKPLLDQIKKRIGRLYIGIDSLESKTAISMLKKIV